MIMTTIIAALSLPLVWAYQLLNLVDMAQTIEFLSNNGHGGRFREANPLYGAHPSPARIVTTKLLLGLFHIALVCLLLRGGASETGLAVLLWLSIVVQGGVVGWNVWLRFFR